MAANAVTEGVVEYSSMLQPSNNSHAPVTAFIFSCSGTDVLPQRDDGSGKPCVVIQPYSIYWHPLGTQAEDS